ncbi:MAG TPA: cation:proton antiporter [Opitutaceae bacterium]|nr:cation:proton antiporter [Opitutaceae bacterium]
MDHYTLLQDFVVLLLAAGLAGMLCKRIGLSAIVGYLLAGILIGPYSPPFSLITDTGHIAQLSHVGLVFLMFAIGLELSLSKLRRMGLPIIMATVIGALFMFAFTLLLGRALGWTPLQSLFVAAMLMVSSSAVIAKIMSELKLNHDRAAQMALAITIVEDVVAVVMLTVLATQGGQNSVGVGEVLIGLTAFVVLFVCLGLLLLPRLLRWLEKRADLELQTLVVSGILFLLALTAIKAGYSVALGAFLFGALVAEMPQKHAIEESFGSLRNLFGSIFFVSIGMMIDVRLLGDIWLLVLALSVFSLVVRPIACGFALMLVGIPPRQARRGGLLLTPLGEFTFIIAQAGIAAAILPASFYPLAVGLSVLTVLATPIMNRFADPILRGLEIIEPAPITRLIAAYQTWLHHLQNRDVTSVAWKLIRSRLVQVAVEILFVAGLLIFSHQLLVRLEVSVIATWLGIDALRIAYWSALGLLVVVPLFAVWRNVGALAAILAEAWQVHALPSRFVETILKTVAAIALGSFLYALFPVKLSGFGWAVLGLAAVAVVTIFSRKLIYWHSTWQHSVNEVLAGRGHAAGPEGGTDRDAMAHRLETWDMQLHEFTVPAGARYAGQTLSKLKIPARFGCFVVEVERNNFAVSQLSPDFACFPGDKLLLLGRNEEISKARAFLEGDTTASSEPSDFNRIVLEAFVVPTGGPTGLPLGELQIARQTGVRVLGIARADEKIIVPQATEVLRPGDRLLGLGTLDQLRHFRTWLGSAVSA